MASEFNRSAYEGVKDHEMGVMWTHLAYGVIVGQNYQTYKDALIAQMTTLLMDTEDLSEGAAREKALKGIEENEKGHKSDAVDQQDARSDPMMYMSPSVSDASIGGNDAINPYAAFGLDDDIVHDTYKTTELGAKTSGVDRAWGMGRCYGEMYESKQQILYLTAGVPKFRNLQTWLQNATDSVIAETNDRGSASITTHLGSLLKKGVMFLIELPWMPIELLYNYITSARNYKVTEYFYFQDTMPLYYRYVNTLLSEIAVGMGIYSATSALANNGANISPEQMNRYQQNLPEIMKEGPDIFKIVSRRALRAGTVARTVNDVSDEVGGTDALISQEDSRYKEQTDESSGWSISKYFSSFWTGLKTGALEGGNFIGFRIEKSDNANESFSNTLGNSPLLDSLNGEVAKNREQSMGMINQGGGVVGNIVSAWNKVSSFKKRAAEFLSGNMDDLTSKIAYVAAGNGYFDLPKQWAGSNGVSRSLSFNMKLRAKTGGDPVSIFQSIMVPLSCIMAMALPRAAGDSTYTSPFLVRAFCKGMFAIPAGMITTLSITRGASEFGWSLSRIPTVVDVNFTIEDLSPILFLSIAAGKGAISGMFQAYMNNSKMHEYINTLTGIGAMERYFMGGNLQRRIDAATLIARNTVFSATYHGYTLGNSSIIRSLIVSRHWTRVPKN